MPSVLWRCWLGGRKGIRSGKKTEWWGAGMVICLEQGADLLMVQLMPLPLTVSCFIKIRTGFTFLVPAHLGSPRKRAVKCVCVCACVNNSLLQVLPQYTYVWLHLWCYVYNSCSACVLKTLTRLFILSFTNTHPFNGPLSGITRVSRYQKGKTNLDSTEARDSERQWHLTPDR